MNKQANKPVYVRRGGQWKQIELTAATAFSDDYICDCGHWLSAHHWGTCLNATCNCRTATNHAQAVAVLGEEYFD